MSPLPASPGDAAESARHQNAVSSARSTLDKLFCYPVDWFFEPLPLENRYGSCMRDAIRRKTDPGASCFGLPLPEDEQPTTPHPMKVLVFADGSGFCQGIVSRAPKGLVGKQQLVTKPPASISQKEVAQLMKPGWDLVIFGSGMDLPASHSVADIIEQQDAVSRLYLYVLQEIAKNEECCKRLACLTVDTFAEEAEIHKEVGLGILTGSTLYGMTNTARHEVDVPMHYIETEWSLPEKCLPELASEVFRAETFGRCTVRILKSGRYVLRQVRGSEYAEAGRAKFKLPDQGGIIAISGGNGALALVMGMWLLQQAYETGKRGFVIKFLSRSARISDSSLRDWEDIQRRAQKLGIVVEQAKCDVSQKAAVEKLVEECSPRLFGIIHAAGILQDALLANQTWEKFDACFAPKNRAALYLHDALEKFSNPQLNFFWMFSSTSVYGNMGQLNYSGSNAMLDALARHRRALGQPAMTVQWGAWGEVGMAAQLDEASKKRFQQSPMPPFLNAEGIKGLEMGIRSNLPYFSVFKYNGAVLSFMVQHNPSTVASHGRNFTSHLMPLPEPSNMNDPYDVFRSLTGGTAGQPEAAGLVWRACYEDDTDCD
eukprot:TRINITY_DN59737_c0_g1_i1.p1 TRINITY_DN59737_c0_g1~~TRINITY_DN59737_c0_g1_i1.p1  ORF type:complete len:599 (-),score=156.37 TRINITY_DN59737_c0_g1_i1:176-1972(-)